MRKAPRRRNWRSSFNVIAWFALAIFVWVTLKLHSHLKQQPDFVTRTSSTIAHQLQQGFLHNANSTDHASTNQSFSACLLVMDDNHLLIEWLAYHYFTLPLSRVILAVDPRSQTSPDHVLHRWQDRIQLERWNDLDYMTSDELRGAEHYVKKFFKAQILDQPDLIRHRARQRIFYYKCMQRLKTEDRGWVVLIDTDEFLSINYPTVRRLGLHAPPMEQQGSVLAFIEKEVQRPGNNLTSACIQIPRLRFGAVESLQQEISRLVPLGFNASHFQTLRWRKHAAPRNLIQNKISKTIIDLKRVGWDMLAPVDSIHRPVMSICGHRRLYIQNKDQVFVIHHYLGSLEQYFYRNDSRTGKERSLKAFELASRIDETPVGNDDLRPWLQGFITRFGYEASAALMEGAGALERRFPLAVHRQEIT